MNTANIGNTVDTLQEQDIRKKFFRSIITRTEDGDIRVGGNGEDGYYIRAGEDEFIFINESGIQSVDKDKNTLRLGNGETRYYDPNTGRTSFNKIRDLRREGEIVMYGEYVLNFDQKTQSFIKMTDQEMQEAIYKPTSLTVTKNEEGTIGMIRDQISSNHQLVNIFLIDAEGVKFIQKDGNTIRILGLDLGRNLCTTRHNQSFKYDPESLEILEVLPGYESYDYYFEPQSDTVLFKRQGHSEWVSLQYDFENDDVVRFGEYYVSGTETPDDNSVIYTHNIDEEKFISSGYLHKGTIVTLDGSIVNPDNVIYCDDIFIISGDRELFDREGKLVTTENKQTRYTPNYKGELVPISENELFEVEIAEGVFQEYHFEPEQISGGFGQSDEWEIPESIEGQDTYMQIGGKRVFIHIDGKKVTAKLSSLLIDGELHICYIGTPIKIDSNGMIHVVKYENKNFIYNSGEEQWYYIDGEISIHVTDEKLIKELSILGAKSPVQDAVKKV